MRPRTPTAWLVNGLLALLAAAALLPLVWMVAVSLMPTGASSAEPPPLWPDPPTLAAYRELLGRAGMGRRFINSLGLAAAVTAGSGLLNTMAGYAFAKLRFAGRDRMFRLLLGALVIPGQVAMLPLFLLLKQIGLVNTYGGVVVPALASVFGIFLVRQNAIAIPDDLLEAARLDGANEWQIFRSIIVPLLRPVLATLAVLTFLGSWNDFMWPLIVLSDVELQTLPIGLATLAREHVQDNELMMAGSVVTVAPVLILFLLVQKQYIDSLASSVRRGW